MTVVKVRIRICPLQRDLEDVILHGQEMQFAMRRLRQDLKKCRDCVQKANCPHRQQFNQQVALAIREINDEYHLAEFYQ